jgi:hypothetical protein
MLRTCLELGNIYSRFNGDLGDCSSIAIDSNNKIHISYRDFSNQDLKYATNLSGTWKLLYYRFSGFCR